MTEKEKLWDVVKQYERLAHRAAETARKMADRKEHIAVMADLLDEEGAGTIMAELAEKGLIGVDGRITAFRDCEETDQAN